MWVFGAAALLLPGQPSLRRDVQRSELLQRLNSIVPPDRLLSALARVDPFPTIAGPEIPTAPLDGPIVDIPRCARQRQRRPHPRHGLRPRDRGQRLGRRAGRRRHRRARRRGRARDLGGRARLGSAARRRGDRLRPEERRRHPARARARRPPARVRRAGGEPRGRDRRLPAERPARRRGRPRRHDREGAHRRRVREGPRRPDDHEPRRGDPARELRRPGDRQRRARPDDRLRDEDRQPRRIRNPRPRSCARCCSRRGRRSRPVPARPNASSSSTDSGRRYGATT